MNTLCDVSLVVPVEEMSRIQEVYVVIGHTICHLIDEKLRIKL